VEHLSHFRPIEINFSSTIKVIRLHFLSKSWVKGNKKTQNAASVMDFKVEERSFEKSIAPRVKLISASVVEW